MPDERTYGFSRDDATDLVNLIGSREGTYSEIKPRGGSARRQVILKEDLYAAVNTDTDPSYAQAFIRRKISGGNLQVTTEEITVVNRFKNISVDAGLYAKAEWIDGEWQLYAADCPGDSSSSEDE